MKAIRIGVIGGTGGMGRWFARFLEKEGHIVHVSGRKTGMDIRSLARGCQVVIVSVPISVTCQVIRQIGPHMSEGSLLMDLTSLKAKPVKAMLKSSTCEVIGLHPLFGPRVRSMKGKNILICPARGEKWLPWLRDTFSGQGARLTETTPARHDQIMAIVQGLTHLNTLTMGLALGRMGIRLRELQGFFTPLFRSRLATIRKIFASNPRLYAEIIALSPHGKEILRLYEGALGEVGRPVRKKDPAALVRLMEEGVALRR